MSSTPGLSTEEETPVRSSLWTGGPLARLHAPRGYNAKDDMEVFSPLVEVQPITPSLDKIWDEPDLMKNHDKKHPFSSSRRFTLSEDGGSDAHTMFDWKSASMSKQVFTMFILFR